MYRHLLSSSALVLSLIGSAAAAQEAVGLEEVIVTAERRAADIQRTPIAITAVSGEDVEQSVNRAEQLTALAPSLNVATTGGMTQIYVRGVGNLAGTSFAEGAIAFNVDQVYVARPTAFDGVFYDLERVEVLKGPQGTLYGRNATGGAINIITNKPVLGEFGGTIGVEVGNYDLVKVSGAANLPLGDTLAARVAFQTVSHDGYLSDGYNDQDSTAARVHLFYQPTEDLSLLLSADYIHLGGQGDAPVPVYRTCGDWCGPTHPSNIALARVGGFAGIILVPGGDGVGFQDNTFWSVTADLEWNLGFAQLSAIASHRTAEIDSLAYPSLFRGRVLDQSAQDSLEVRLSSAGEGPLQWVVGVYAFEEDVDGDYSYSHGLALQAQQVKPNIINKSNAVFGQATYSVTDTVRVTGGVRYLKDEKTLGGLQRCFSGILCGAPLGSGLPGTRIALNESGEWDHTSYRAGVEWDIGPQSMIYANVSTGFKSGGFYPAALNAEFGPEELTAYAIGTKNRFFDNRLQVNAEAFWWDYKGHQESHVGTACVAAVGGVCTAFGNVYLTENVGEAEIKGIDFDAVFLVTPNDRLSFSVGYLDAVATSFTYNVPLTAPPAANIACTTTRAPPFWNINCSGNPMPRAPEWNGRVAYEHTFELASGARVVAEASTFYSDGYYASIDYVPGAYQDSYTKSAASITYHSPDDRWSAAAWVDNIEDEPVAGTTGTKLFANTAAVQLRAPRTYGVRLNAKFGAP